MRDKILKEANEIYAIKDVHRYNNTFKIKDESVAEHSFFVAAMVLMLHRYFKFNLERALSIAIIHDFSEIYITDVPRSTKLLYPRIDKAVKLSDAIALKGQV